MSLADRPGRAPRVALMQPTFLPWVGYFALLEAADVFVFLDDFQFVRRSFHQRNRLFRSDGAVDWITLPVEHAGTDARATLAEVKPAADARARKKLFSTLRHDYARTPFFQQLAPEVEAWLLAEHQSLAALNIAFVRWAAAKLGLTTPTRLSSEFGSQGRRSARLADLLQRLGAATYLSARGSAGYMMEEGVFPLSAVETFFQHHQPAPYPQVHSAQFVPYLSVLDLLFQAGPERAREVVRAGARPFDDWETMRQAAPATAAEEEVGEQP